MLVLKPSVWFILLISLKTAAAMAICAIASKLWLPEHVAWCDESLEWIEGR